MNIFNYAFNNVNKHAGSDARGGNGPETGGTQEKRPEKNQKSLSETF
jgi:hypothetical protein